MNRKEVIFTGVGVMVTLIIILRVLLDVRWVVTVPASVLAAVLVFLLQKDTGKPNKTRKIVYGIWGFVYATLVFISNTLLHYYFVCPSKIPLAGENAGSLLKIPDTEISRGLLPCPFGVFTNHLSTIKVYGFVESMVTFSIQFWGAILLTWILIAFVLGRAWCGWFCPFGGMMETISSIGKKPILKFKLSKKVITIVSAISFVGVVLLILSSTTAPSVYYCAICPFKGLYHSPLYWPKLLQLITELITFIIFGIFFLVFPFIFKKRIWCTLLCPVGMLAKLLGSISLIQTRITEVDCTGCKKCVNACSLCVIHENGNAVKMDGFSCSGCGECMQVCPNNAIKYYIRGTNIEVKRAYIPLVVIGAFTAAAIFVSVMWKPVFDSILKLF